MERDRPFSFSLFFSNDIEFYFTITKKYSQCEVKAFQTFFIVQNILQNFSIIRERRKPIKLSDHKQESRQNSSIYIKVQWRITILNLVKSENFIFIANRFSADEHWVIWDAILFCPYEWFLYLAPGCRRTNALPFRFRTSCNRRPLRVFTKIFFKSTSLLGWSKKWGIWKWNIVTL